MKSLSLLLLGLLTTASLRSVAAPPPRAPESTNTAHARVVVAHDGSATVAFAPDAAVVRRLVDEGLLGLTGKTSTAEAWPTLVSSTDTVGFKVTSGPGAVSGTRPAVVSALIESLLAAGHPSARIVIWDKRARDLREAGWLQVADKLGVRCIASEDVGWDETKSYESALIGRLVAGDREFGQKETDTTGRRSFVTKLLTHELTKIVSVAPDLSHSVGGVNGHLVGLAWAGADNTLRFANDPARLSEAVPDICALDDVLPRLAFAVTDALICQFRGEEGTLLHYSVALNELRFSKDPVALDALSLADVERSRAAAKIEGEKKPTTELYSNAELIELGVADPKRIDITRVP